MAKTKSAQILSLEDTEKTDDQEYQVAGLAGLIKSKFLDAEDARRFDEERWLRAYRNYRGVYGNDMAFTESEKSKVVNVLVANPFKNSVKTSSLNVKLTSELSVVIEEVDIIALELSRVKVIPSVPRFELNGKPEVDTVAVTKFTDEETVQK